MRSRGAAAASIHSYVVWRGSKFLERIGTRRGQRRPAAAVNFARTASSLLRSSAAIIDPLAVRTSCNAGFRLCRCYWAFSLVVSDLRLSHESVHLPYYTLPYYIDVYLKREPGAMLRRHEL